MKRLLLTSLIIFCFTNSSFAFSLKQSENFVQKEEYQSLSQEANVYYAQNNIVEAKNILISIPDDERSPQNWLLIGNILQDEGKLSEAEFMYKKAISVDEKYYKAYYNLGNLYFMQDKFNMAAEQFLKVTKLQPEYAYGHYNLGCTYLKLEKYSKAKFELLTATDYNNHNPDFYYNLAYVYKKLNKEKAAKTYIDMYNKLIENN